MKLSLEDSREADTEVAARWAKDEHGVPTVNVIGTREEAEEVVRAVNEREGLQNTIGRVRDYVTLQPLDLLKPHEIQRDVLAILKKADQ